MPFLMIAAALALADQPKIEAPIMVVGRPWAPFISPMGEPFRATAANDDPFARWFHQADRNTDGTLTLDEMQADADRFFLTIDDNHDGQIDPEEINVYETEVTTEVQVDSKWKRSRQELAEAKPAGAKAPEPSRPHHGHGSGPWGPGDNGIDGYQIYGLQGAARYGLLNIPEPVAGADADFNRSITLEEFRRAAAQRFQLLDSKNVGRLAIQDLEPLLPTRPKGKKLRKFPNEDPRDQRVGLPLPEGN